MDSPGRSYHIRREAAERIHDSILAVGGGGVVGGFDVSEGQEVEAASNNLCRHRGGPSRFLSTMPPRLAIIFSWGCPAGPGTTSSHEPHHRVSPHRCRRGHNGGAPLSRPAHNHYE